MSTYGEKVAKYEARVRKMQELGAEPVEKDVKKLVYYVGRAQKKGADHETKLKDKLHCAKAKLGKTLKATVKELLPIAAAIVAQRIRS